MAESLEVLEDWEDWDPNSGESFFIHALAGSLAGGAEHCVMYPVDTIKTHMQASHSTESPMTNNPFRMFRSLIHSEASGVFRLWRGVSTMLTACVPAHAAYFSIFEQCRVSFGADGSELTPIASGMSGVLSTIAHDAIMTPMDVAKQRLQLGFYKGPIDCLTSVARTEGIRSLFLSFPTTLIMNIPYAAVMVATNESAKKIINPNNVYDIKAFIASGAIAGAVAAIATNPMDVVKTRLQTQNILSAYAHCENLNTSNKAASHVPQGFNKMVLHRHGRETGLIGPFSGNGPRYGIRYSYTAKDTAQSDLDCLCKGSSEPKNLKYSGFIETVKKIHAEEGLKGFTRGIYSRLLVHAPSVAISWTTYETAKKLLS